MSKARFIKHIFPVILIAMFSGNAVASLITFTHEGSGSGSIAGTSFTNADFIITAVGNTDNRAWQANLGNGGLNPAWFIDHSLATITITDVGTFDFITGTRTFVTQDLDLVGFSRAGDEGADLFQGPTNTVFSTWDMLTSIGPYTGEGNLLQWTLTDVETTGGLLAFNTQYFINPVTFTAVVSPIPVPAAAWLFGSGLIGLIGIARRKKV